MALPPVGNVRKYDPLVKSYASKVAKPMESTSFKMPIRFSVDINCELGSIFIDFEKAKAAYEYKFAIVMKFVRARPSNDNIRLHIVKKMGFTRNTYYQFYG